MAGLPSTRSVGRKRLALALAILAVIAFSSSLSLPEVVVTALVVALSQASQFFFQSHKDANDNEPATP